MEVRLSDVLAAHCGLVNDKLAGVIRVVLHEADQSALDNLPPGCRRFAPTRMARGIWLQLLDTKGLPLSIEIAAAFATTREGDRTAAQNADDALASSMIFLELAGAEFKCDVNIDGELLPVGNSRSLTAWSAPHSLPKVGHLKVV